MEISDRVRTIWARRLNPRGEERPSIIFYGKKKVVLAAAVWTLLLACGSARALQPAQPGAGPPDKSIQRPTAPWGYDYQYRRIRPIQYSGQFVAREQPRQEHLPLWFRQHQNLPPWAQEKALRSEPGFSRLPSWKQQRLIYRLRQLNAMPPAQRERTLERMEALERLSPEQRQQVRNTIQRITEMPEERRRRMHNAFQELSQVAPMQRRGLLNSPEYKRRFSYQELQMLATLMSVQPYTPETPARPGTMYGGPPRR